MFFQKKKKVLVVHTCGYDKEGYPDDNEGKIRTFGAIKKILEDEDVKYVIFSGGMPREFNSYKTNLAKSMYTFFIKDCSIKVNEKILPYSQNSFAQVMTNNFFKQKELYLFLETESIDTRENVIFSKKIINNIEKAFGEGILPVFLSSKYHLNRIEKVIKEEKIKKFELVCAEEELNIEKIHPSKQENIIRWLYNLGFSKQITNLMHILRK